MGKVSIDIDADIQPVSDFRAHASAMLKHVRDTGRPLVLTQRGRSAAVLVDVLSYQALLDELDELRDVHRGLADEEAGRLISHEQAKKQLLDRYK